MRIKIPGQARNDGYGVKIPGQARNGGCRNYVAQGGFMRIITIAIVTLCIATAGFAQSAMLAVNLSQKPVATVEDAVTLFILSTDGTSQGYAKDAQALVAKGILPKVYDPKAPASTGLVAYMVAMHAHITHSLMFNIFKSQRYAVFACISAGYLPANAGERVILSGVELMEIMGRFGGEE